MFAASFDSKMGCLYSVFDVKKQGKTVWVVRARNWKLRGGENRLSGLLEGVSHARDDDMMIDFTSHALCLDRNENDDARKNRGRAKGVRRRISQTTAMDSTMGVGFWSDKNEELSGGGRAHHACRQGVGWDFTGDEVMRESEGKRVERGRQTAEKLGEMKKWL
ncbi:hypothetical protein GQ457_05G029070 [Hibiscus cannabinus]